MVVRLRRHPDEGPVRAGIGLGAADLEPYVLRRRGVGGARQLRNIVLSHGQDIYEKWSVGTGLCFVGDAHCFNSTVNVDADYRPFWDGVVGLSSVDYGLHIGASLSRWASLAGDARAGDVLRASSLESLVTMFPESFVAQYLRSLQS